MLSSSPGVATARPGTRSSMETLDAMARLASQSGSVVHVVTAREPGVLRRARAAAAAAGVDITADVMNFSIRVRFSGSAL
jgi:hypothetical protein